jgi:hypothetical protein
MVYSSGENLFVQFTTLKRTADSQNRGFSGWFEFSERFVNLGKNNNFIQNSIIYHFSKIKKNSTLSCFLNMNVMLEIKIFIFINDT